MTDMHEAKREAKNAPGGLWYGLGAIILAGLLLAVGYVLIGDRPEIEAEEPRPVTDEQIEGNSANPGPVE